MMALLVAGGAGCVLPLLARRRRRAFRPPRAVAVAKEEDGRVLLGGSGVAVTKLGIGAWSWGDTTYWNEFQWDDSSRKGDTKNRSRWPLPQSLQLFRGGLAGEVLFLR